MHEASLYDENCFITLTYNDEHLPVRAQLVYRDYVLFMKRLRKNTGARVRFFCAGEYGDLDARPHFHALLFGYDFPDKEKWRKLDSGCETYTSKILEGLWPKGFSSIGQLTFESAAYVARYCLKKVTGKGAMQHYERVDEFGEYELEPELAHMSNRPGIGKPWLEKFKTDVYPHDYVIVNGKKVKPPKYYDNLYSAEDPENAEWMKFQRMKDAEVYADDNTPERLKVKEQVTKAKIGRYQRNFS